MTPSTQNTSIGLKIIVMSIVFGKWIIPIVTPIWLVIDVFGLNNEYVLVLHTQYRAITFVIVPAILAFICTAFDWHLNINSIANLQSHIQREIWYVIVISIAVCVIVFFLMIILHNDQPDSSSISPLPTGTSRPIGVGELISPIEEVTSTVLPTNQTSVIATPTVISSQTPSTLSPTVPPVPALLRVHCGASVTFPFGVTFHAPNKRYQNFGFRELEAILKELSTFENADGIEPSDERLCSSNMQKLIASTASSQNSSISSVLHFRPQGYAGLPTKAVWLLVSADATSSEQLEQIIGVVSGKFSPTSDEVVHIDDLQLGVNIADWNYEGDTVTRYRHQQGVIYRPWTGLNSTGKRAAQLFAVRLEISPDYQQNPLFELLIEDKSSDSGISVMAALFVPSSLMTPSMPISPASTPLCLRRQVVPSANNYSRGFDEIVTIEIMETYLLKTGCGEEDWVTIPEVAPDVKFAIDRVYETRVKGLVNLNPIDGSEITLKLVNTTAFDKLYLLLSARNVCLNADEVSQNPDIGQIEIRDNDSNNSVTIQLTLNENLRQGRTNIDICNVQGARELPTLGRQPNNTIISAEPGIPVRAIPGAETGNTDAEIWLDLVVVEIPEKMRGKPNLTITIRDQSTDFDQPFIALYAATLVQDKTNQPSDR
jgi:hypothetical protein